MSPYFLLSVLLGGAYGSLFHIWQGKSATDIFYYFPAGVIGFGLGQVAAKTLGWQFLLIGPIHIIEASIGCIVILLLARWLRF